MAEVGWRLHAACRFYGPEWFYSSDPDDVSLALQICSGCIVRRQCAESAVVHGEEGVWGGLTEEERGAKVETGEWLTAG